jgi:hypothetical protein
MSRRPLRRRLPDTPPFIPYPHPYPLDYIESVTLKKQT